MMVSTEMMIAATALIATMIVAMTALRCWQGWIQYKLRELDRFSGQLDAAGPGSPEGAARIELADLKERIRKLEAIANGVDL